MAEAAAALVLGAAVISFIDIGGKVIVRLREYIQTSQEVPEVLRDVHDRLETLLLTTKNLHSALNAGKLDDGASAALKSTVGGLERQALVLQGLCERILPSLGDIWWQKARKAVSSLWKEKELKSVLQKIIAYESTLNLYFTTKMSLKDSSSVPWTKRTYYDVPPFAHGRFIGRRRMLDRVAASFKMDDLEHRMTTVLLGIGGQGKTMIAREYCRRLRDQVSLFWVDASSYPTARSGMQRASQLLDSSITSDSTSHMQTLSAAKLENLLHPFLIVLDNMDHAKDFTQIMQLMPENKLCMVLITTRHRDAQQLGTCIEIESMEQDEAVELLLTKCNIASDLQHQSHAESIVQTLAYLPLAIDQAGAYISSRNLPLAQFPDHFEIRKEMIMKYIPSAWAYQRAHDDQQRVSDLCVFTTWELSLQELGSSVDVEPFIDLLTFAAFTGSSRLLPKMLKTQVEENLAAELGCRDLYTSEGKWDPWKYQDAIVQLYSVSLISEIDMRSAEISFVIHPLVEEWLKVRAGEAKDKMFIEASTKLTHRICDRHIERVTNFYSDERRALIEDLVKCAIQNGYFERLTTNAEASTPLITDTNSISKLSEVFVLALPSFVRCCMECGEIQAAGAFSMAIHSYLELGSGFVMTADLLQRFLCANFCAEASIVLYDSEVLDSLRISNGVLRPAVLKRLLESDKLNTLGPGERCVLWLELLWGQVCIALGEIEAARQLLSDGFVRSHRTFGMGDVLTMEFRTTLAEVYIERREIELAIKCLSPELTTKKSGGSDICAITAQTLVAKTAYITGLLGEADFILKNCLHQALSIVLDDHPLIWRIRYDIIEVRMLQEDYATAEKYFRDFRDVIIDAKGPGHLEVLYMTLDLAFLKLRISGTEEAGPICQALLVLLQKRDTDTHDLITLTKTILWFCNLHSGKIDSEVDLRNDLLESLENGSLPNPQLARRWGTVALLAEKYGAVDVASVLKKHYYKAMELAFGIEYPQVIEREDASLENSKTG